MLTACGTAPPATSAMLVERSFVSMGSSLRVAIWTTDQRAAAAAADRVKQEFDRVEALLSVWKPGSDIARLNEAAGVRPVIVHQDTLEVLEYARDAGVNTNGKFDITFGALAGLWKFDHDQDNRIPDRAAIEQRLPLVDYTAIKLDRGERTAFITRRGVRVHLGGIGKGYAIDHAVNLLRAAEFADFLIQAGGDMFASGDNNGSPWKLGIADPRGDHAPFAAVEVRDATLSTSGDYERFFIEDGVRYHHLIDPDSGQPARGCRSVTIVARRAVHADVLSTGVFIMGPDAGMKLIEAMPDVEGVIVTAANQVLVSSGLKGRVDLRGGPTDAP